MTIEEVVRGPNQLDGPAPGMWHVTGRPDSGITPKFTIRDERGNTYSSSSIRRSSPSFPRRSNDLDEDLPRHRLSRTTGLHRDIRRVEMDVAPGAKIRTESGSKRLIRMADVEQWLKNAPRTASGSIRALASLWVPGKVVGQYRYTGTRPDDPNESIRTNAGVSCAGCKYSPPG